MFCPQCGTQVPDGTKFCGNCGFDLSSSQSHAHSTSDSAFAQAAGSVPPQQPAQPSQQPVSNPQYAQPQYAQESAPADPQFGTDVPPSESYGQPYGQSSYGQPQGGQQQYGTYAGPQGAPYGQAQSASTSSDPSAILAAVVWPKSMPSAKEFFQAHNESITQYAESRGLGMGFYKFCAWHGWAYLGLFFGVIGALVTMFGGEYSSLAFMVYPALRAVCILDGLWLLAAVALELYARMLLAQYKRGATETMLVVSVLSTFMSAFISFLANVVTGSDVISSMISLLFGAGLSSLVSYLIYKNYFFKRKFLFVN